MSEHVKNKTAVRAGSFWRTVKAVAWSFLGVRRNSDFQDDVAKINPFHIIAVGIAGALLFVGSLIALVNWVVAK
jgi:hypothetical protein